MPTRWRQALAARAGEGGARVCEFTATKTVRVQQGPLAAVVTDWGKVAIRGGQVYGSSDKVGAYPASDPVDPADIQATIYHCMGLDPELTVYDHLRRPYALSTGRVLTPLV